MSESNTATGTMIPAGADQKQVNELVQRLKDGRLNTSQRLITIEQILRANSAKIFQALPKHFTADRMIRVILTALRKDRSGTLAKCEPLSLFGAMTEAATYGWEIGGILGHAYLVAFWNGTTKCYECQLIPGYKGLIDLCRRSGQVSTIALEVVHEGDKFEYTLGDDPKIIHKPNDRDPKRDDKPISHVYAVVKLRDGGTQRSVWSREKIDHHKEQYSKGWAWAENGDKGKGGSKKDSAWHTAWPTMAKKTVIRDMVNRGLVPMSPEYREMASRAEIHDSDETLDLTLLEGTATELDGDDMPAGAIEGDVAGDGDAGEGDEQGGADETSQDNTEAFEANTLRAFKTTIDNLNEGDAVAYELEKMLQSPDLSDGAKSKLTSLANQRRDWLAKTGASDKSPKQQRGKQQRNLVN